MLLLAGTWPLATRTADRMRIGSLCSGIGGLDMGVSRATGATTAWFCEREPAPRRVLERHYPGVPIHDDLTTQDWDAVEPVDIITAGYPCQPFSLAGNRKGTADERHLWPHVADCIRRVGPRYVVLENVRGHLTLGFDRVLGDLADLGFDARWALLRASDVGAPHRRERIFVVAAYADNVGHERRRPARGGWDGSPHGDVHAANADRQGLEGSEPARRHLVPAGRAAADADCRGRCINPWQHSDQTHAAEADDEHRDEPAGRGNDRGRPDMGRYEAAVGRWERLHGPAPAPLNGRRLNPAFVCWMMGYPAGWVDGLTRSEALKALGNAVVPQVAEMAWGVLS